MKRKLFKTTKSRPKSMPKKIIIVTLPTYKNIASKTPSKVRQSRRERDHSKGANTILTRSSDRN